MEKLVMKVIMGGTEVYGVETEMNVEDMEHAGKECMKAVFDQIAVDKNQVGMILMYRE